MRDYINEWLSLLDISLTSIQMSIAVVTVIVLISALIHLIFHQVVSQLVRKLTRKGRKTWEAILFERHLFSRLALTIQGIILYIQAGLWLNPKYVFHDWIQNLSQVWIVIFMTLTLFSVVDAMAFLMRQNKRTKNLPFQGLLQAVKLFFTIVAIIVLIAIAIDRSPMLIISGLGAMTAVLLLVFKDPILGFVAGIQLSANNLLKLGDWLEMPSYGADGDVIEIGLTTVKVQNWDKTITSIPTYALISDSFKNWQGMSESGGRRIKRAVYIDVTSIKFMQKELIERLNKANLLAPYMSEKLEEIEQYNQTHDHNMELKINGRRLTNIGTFRAYLINYLKHHPNIHQDMTLLVRQLQASSQGVPIQIYAFTNTTAWNEYESIQSDIFDHIYAVIDEFELQIYQSPSSNDLKNFGITSRIN
ncbi:MAG: mechanosensitive ion channel domain-containing protein [Kangiellaceae bacterium]|jgi:miniconductance mechanosensitive channel